MSGDFTPPPGSAADQSGSSREQDWSAPRASAPSSRPEGGTTTVRRAGRGMVIAAWIAIAAGVMLLIGISWSVALEVQNGGLEPAQANATGELHTMQVVPGMCLETMPEDGAVREAPVVDCDRSHSGEAITSLLFSELRYPGDDEVAERALEHCSTRMTDLGEGSSWVAWVPSADSWQRGDRTALCIATFDSPREGRVGPDRSGSSSEQSSEPEDGQEA